MAALIESMVWTGETPWHGLGTQVDGLLTAEEVIAKAELDWLIRLRPAFAKLEDGTYVPIEGYNATVRSRDDLAYAPVGRKYQTVQNQQSLDFMDALTGEGTAKYETAGSLKQGRVCWVLAKIPNGGGVDPVERYLLTTWAHDGSAPVRVIPTNVRVVCWNTLSLAIREADGRKVAGFVVRHRGNIEGKISIAKRVLADSIKYFDKAAVLFDNLKNESFGNDKIEKVAANVFHFGQPEQGNDPESRKSKRDAEILNNVIYLANHGRGTDLPGVKGTAWGAWNAFTEYADWHSPIRLHNNDNSAEKRLESNWFGTGAELKEASLDEIIRLTRPALAA
jgi:phage/plasmid-like protein (TIGR03299 family)